MSLHLYFNRFFFGMQGTREVQSEGSWGEYADPVGLIADTEEGEATGLTNLGLCRLTGDTVCRPQTSHVKNRLQNN